MKLDKLLNIAGIKAPVSPLNLEITGIEYDSRQVRTGDLFVAIQGYKTDGHRFIVPAIHQGASAIVCEIDPHIQKIPVITVPNSRKALARLSQAFYNTATLPFHLTGITGTNGKTTLTLLLRELEKQAGFRTAISGTLGFLSDFEHGSFSDRTTPESRDLHKMFHTCSQAGIQSLIMEVSSIALELSRVENVTFDTAVFTNLTQDHLDFHGNMDRYFAAKIHLFSQLTSEGTAIINIDDPYGSRLFTSLNHHKRSCSLQNPFADYHFSEYHLSTGGLKGVIHTPDHTLSVEAPLIGVFNAMNLLQAVAAWMEHHSHIRPDYLNLKSLPAIPGRMDIVRTAQHGTVIIDFAHTPDAIDKILKSVQEIPHERLIVLFGCGGDRDKTKRPLMGQIAEQYADQIILTNDNPRSEPPEAILEDIRKGIKTQQNLSVEPDRQKAIYQVLTDGNPGDLILILGKGAEEVMEIGEEKIPFNDKDIVQKWVQTHEI
ncbi:MAG: UDP-N-acetylmuramoyl-L-alanyl-D-glutamate--2,6-diaminopimelate ligase [Candidatus Marinimicrobia bacterium]|nr:UDP-N-acetylmuramoyl-L-alanyl-D-glutamate--2,6-diaminopimelate ligase [Candidatus Neomarinimicrobiota bacterium]